MSSPDDDSPSPRAALSTRETLVQWRKTVVRLWPFSRPHRRWLALGSVAALFVIGLRLALPMVFRALLRSSFGDGASAPVAGGAGVELALQVGGGALVLAATLGLADHLERLWFARFAGGLARDLRRAVYREELSQSGAPAGAEPARPPGEVAFGLVGDTARMKTGVKGFLVHVATNLALSVGVVVVMFVTSPVLGAIFAGAGALSFAFTLRGALRVYEVSKLSRKRESKLAHSIASALSSGVGDARTEKLVERDASIRALATRAQGETTWAAHALFGGALLGAIVFAAYALEDGTLTRTQILTFFLYALMVRAPLVQLARQGARAGKILASAHRVGRLLREAAPRSDGRIGGTSVEKRATSGESEPRAPRPSSGPP